MMAPTPVLHAGETVARLTVDWRVLAVALVALVVALVIIWRPTRLRAPLHATRARSLARTAVCALALLAVLPSVLPYDHLILDVPAGDAETHAQHCHGAGECSSGGASSVAAPFVEPESLLAAPALTSVLLLLLIAPLTGVTRRPEPRPPAFAST